MKIKTFSIGGIHPEENKLTHEVPTQVAPLPKQAIFPLSPILEQSENNVFVMKCDFGWADLGTWHAIYEVMHKVKDDNVVMDSEVILEDCKNNIIKLPKGKLGVFNGLEGYIVAEEDGVLLICKKSDNSSMVKKYVNEVRIKYGDEFV